MLLFVMCVDMVLVKFSANCTLETELQWHERSLLSVHRAIAEGSEHTVQQGDA